MYSYAVDGVLGKVSHCCRKALVCCVVIVWLMFPLRALWISSSTSREISSSLRDLRLRSSGEDHHHLLLTRRGSHSSTTVKQRMWLPLKSSPICSVGC